MRNALFITCSLILATCGFPPDKPGPAIYVRYGLSYDLVPYGDAPAARFVPIDRSKLDYEFELELTPVGQTLAATTPPWTEEEKEWVYRGAYQWEKLGYGDVYRLDQTEIDPALQELDPAVSNYPPIEEMRGKYIFVDVYKDAHMIFGDREFAGLHPVDQRVVFLNAKLYGIDNGFYLDGTAAHEIGHMLLDSGHLPEGRIGLMSAAPHPWFLQPDDLWFACDQAQRCNTNY